MSTGKLAKFFFVLATIAAFISAFSLTVIGEFAIGVIAFAFFLFNIIAAVCCDGKYKNFVAVLLDMF